MIQVGLCDDEPILLEALEQKVRQCCAEHMIFSITSCFSSGENLLYEVEDGRHFDLFLLDIEMPGMDGMTLAARLKELLPQALIIFITSHVEYALDAYELSIFRYIPKNGMDNRLKHALLDAASYLQIQQTRSYLISTQNRLERVPLKNLLYICRDEKNALLVTDLASSLSSDSMSCRDTQLLDGHICLRIRKTLQEVYEELDEREFLFIDRGCIVNLSHVMRIRPGLCILKDGTRLAVSQARMAPLKEKMLDFWKDQL